MKILALALFSFFVAVNAHGIVGSHCGDGLFRNIGDACPAGSLKAINVPDNYTGKLSTAAEAADKVGSAGACSCPENFDKVDFKDGTGWRCVWGDENNNFKNVACAVPAAAVAAAQADKTAKKSEEKKTVTLNLAIDAEFENQANCVDTVQSALRVTSLLIPAGASVPVKNANSYCKGLFPTENSPAVKVTMASQFTVSSLEECSTRLNTAKGYAVSVKQAVGDLLEEVEDGRKLCEQAFLAPGQSGDLSKYASSVNLEGDTGSQKVSIDNRAPASVPANQAAPAPAPKKNCPASWGIADPECNMAW